MVWVATDERRGAPARALFSTSFALPEHLAYDAFVVRGSEAQRAVVGWLGASVGTLLGTGIALCVLVAPGSALQRGGALFTAVAGLGAGQLLIRRQVPGVVQDLMLVVAIGVLGYVGSLGGPLHPVMPTLYVALGTTFFAVRSLTYSLVNLGLMGASYGAVLAFGPDTDTPFTRWVAVVSAVLISGLFVRWLVFQAATIARAERAARLDAEAATEELERTGAAKNAFLARMSHELRTPLNVILGFSDALRAGYAGALSPQQQSCVEDISGSGRDLLLLVDELLDVSKVDAGAIELDVSPVDIGRAVADAEALVRGRARQAGVALEVSVLGGPVIADADALRVRQIAWNLLGNAVKFTPRGGRVEVTVQQEDERAVISVRDTGPGIPLADQARIFERFERGVTAPAGAGIGLALSRSLIEAHRGRLSLESRPGRGSTFRVELPTTWTTAPPGPGKVRSVQRAALAIDRPWVVAGSAANRALTGQVARWFSQAAAVLFVVLAVITPGSAAARVGVGGLALLSLLVGVAISRSGAVLTERGTDATGILGIAIVSLSTLAVGPYADLVPLAYGWTILTTAALLTGRKVVLQLSITMVCFGAVLLIDDQPAALRLWIAVGVLLLANAHSISWISAQLHEVMRQGLSSRLAAEATRAQAEAVGEHKRDFLANTSHELCTPLNAIIGFAQVLDDGIAGPLEPKQAEYVTDILETAQHLFALITDLLDLARLEAGHLPVLRQRIAPASIARSVVHAHRATADRCGVELHVDVDVDVPDIEADPRHLGQVLDNLVANGIKFTHPGGRVDIIGRSSDDGAHVLLSVRDTGIGILPEQQEHVFEAFHQGTRPVPDHARGGTGLGLTLAQMLVHIDGGTISVASTPDIGSTFTVALPVPAGTATTEAVLA